MAGQIAAEFGPTTQCQSDEHTAQFQHRLARVTDFLSERGYLARWESADDEAPDEYLLHKHNCPYAGVSSAHQELCLMDQALINELFGQSCERVSSVSNGDTCCTYRIHGGCGESAAAAARVRTEAESFMPELQLVAGGRRAKHATAARSQVKVWG